MSAGDTGGVVGVRAEVGVGTRVGCRSVAVAVCVGLTAGAGVLTGVGVLMEVGAGDVIGVGAGVEVAAEVAADGVSQDTKTRATANAAARAGRWKPLMSPIPQYTDAPGTWSFDPGAVGEEAPLAR